MTSSSNKPNFDALSLISQALSYVKHIRLMLLMMAFGLLLGIVAFLFARPTFQASAMVSSNGIGAPVVNPDFPESFQKSVIDESFQKRLGSNLLQLETLKRMGLVSESATTGVLEDFIPELRISTLGSRDIQISVSAFDPAIVRTFSKELVKTHQILQQKNYEEYREEALRRYTEQVERLEAEIAQSMSALNAVEREQNLTEVTIEQQNLLDIPKRLVQTRERLARMRDVRELLVKLESQAESPGEPTARSGPGGNISNMISLLSLLGSFEDETDVEVGDVISAQGSPVARPVLTPSSSIIAPSDVDSIEPWRKAEKERRFLLDEIARNSQIYLPEHRVMKDLEEKMDATERALETEFKMLRQKFDLRFSSLEQKEKTLQARMPEYYAISEELGKSTRTYADIVGKQKVWDEARSRLAQRLQAIAFAEDGDWIELRYNGFLSMRDEVPVSPNKAKLVIIALMLGLGGAFGAPTMLNLLDTSATTVPQLEQMTGLTGLGIVPLTPKAMLEDVCRSPAQGASTPNYLLECFRVIRANIIMNSNRHGACQVILVTSARPSEGKTTQASNLAWAFQSMGERTILLDCDLRRGRIHGVTGIVNDPGMTRLLLGECKKEDAILSAGPGGFDVIPRGPVIAGTTDLLCQEVFHGLLKQLRGTYDRIVIDAPPCLGLSETSSLQRVVDGTVLVVRAETTGRKDVLDAVSLLKRTHAHFFGFVLNAVDLSKIGNYYNYSYYSASYYDHVEPEAEPARLAGSRA
jgi:polysaccharide biosynthesis transport protein